MKSKNITIDGIQFIMHPLSALTALRLDKQLLQLLLPIVSGLKGAIGKDGKPITLDTDVDLSSIFPIFEVVADSLGKMSESQFESFIVSLFNTVQAIAPGQPAIELRESGALDKVFEKPLTIYKLAFEVMKFNSFTPFEVAGAGSGSITNILNGLNSAENVTFSGLEK